MATRRAVKKVEKKTAKAKSRPRASSKAKLKAKAAPIAVIPYLCCKGAGAALEFYKTGFGARETIRMTGQDGSVGHAEITVSGAPIMISDEWPDGGVFSPTTVGGTPVAIHLYVRDVDTFVAKAVAAGATLLREIEDMPYGDRQGTVRDPFGHRWMVATNLETVSKPALRKRFGDEFKVS
jgi:uncharacterized glyoxalase superfamily protein PhnB